MALKYTNRKIMGEVKCKREEEDIFTVVRDVFVLKGRKHCVKEERRKKATIPDSPLRLILIRGWLGVFGCVWVMILNLRQELQDGGGEQRPDGQSDEIDEWSAHEPRPHQGHHKHPSQSEQTNQSHTQNWVTPHCRTHTHTHTWHYTPADTSHSVCTALLPFNPVRLESLEIQDSCHKHTRVQFERTSLCGSELKQVHARVCVYRSYFSKTTRLHLLTAENNCQHFTYKGRKSFIS